MTLYNQTKMTELEYTATVRRSITSEDRQKRW